MRVVALISGGKDSTYNMIQCIAAGHEIVALANLYPHQQTEVDSYMYQSVGYEAIDLIGEAMQLPLYRKETQGKSVQRDKTYHPTDKDEVEDLFSLLSTVKQNIAIDGVSVGAILSDYQRVRVENVCVRLGLVPLAYLWQRDQKQLLDEMIKSEIEAIIIKVAALGLEPTRHLGRSLRLVEPHLQAMHDKYGLNVCGEGGEYETLTLDCPLYKSRIVIENSEVIMHSDDPVAPVGYLKFHKLRLEPKTSMKSFEDRIRDFPVKDSDGYITDDGEEAIIFEEAKDYQLQNCIQDITEIQSNVMQSHYDLKSGDGWLWVAGIQGHSENPGDAIKEALENLKCILKLHDQNMTDLVSIAMFISDMSQYAELNKLYCDYINHVNPPTRACVQVPLPKNCPVIIEALSWSFPSAMGDANVFRHTMHVQSISHWAPANIGPYSQAIRIGDLIYLAGQIGLVPGNMELVKGGIKHQCHLSLRHIGRLLKAVDNNINMRNVVQGICYVTHQRYINHARKQWEEKTNNAIVDYIVVSGLPRNAAVEWHVWAHAHNNIFQYEETGKCIDKWSILIYRRWNYENNVAAIVCHVENIENVLNEQVVMTKEIFKETIDYTLHKLQLGHENDQTTIYNLKIFCPIQKYMSINDFTAILDDFRNSFSLVFTIVPVVHLTSKHTFLSICGVRNQ